MADKIIRFYNPTDLGMAYLGVTQLNKIIPFKTLNGVFMSGSKVDAYLDSKIIKTYTISNGINLIGDNSVGQEKTAELSLNGNDFKNYINRSNILFKCSFWNIGDVDYIFNLKLF